MADDATKHNAHAESLAFVSEQHKVSGFKQLAPTEHISHTPSDLEDAINAQGVTTHKDNFLGQNEASPDIQSGPRKAPLNSVNELTSISETTKTSTESTNPPLSEFAHNALHGGGFALKSTADSSSGINSGVVSGFNSIPKDDDSKEPKMDDQETDDLFGGNTGISMGNGMAPNEDIIDNDDAALSGNEEEEKETFLRFECIECIECIPLNDFNDLNLFRIFLIDFCGEDLYKIGLSLFLLIPSVLSILSISVFPPQNRMDSMHKMNGYFCV